MTVALLGGTAVSSSYLLGPAFCAWEAGLLGCSGILAGHGKPRRERSGDFLPSWQPQLWVPAVTAPSDGPSCASSSYLGLGPGAGNSFLPSLSRFTSPCPVCLLFPAAPRVDPAKCSFLHLAEEEAEAQDNRSCQGHRTCDC